MKKINFLIRLKEEGKISIIKPSGEIKESYVRKSAGSLKSAKILLENEQIEDAVPMAYYSMYNMLTALLYKAGIKCENHSASIIILKDCFNQSELYLIFSKAKEERIDKQYYVSPSQNNPATEDSAKEMIGISMKFNPQITAFKNSLNLEDIEKIRDKIKDILKLKKNEPKKSALPT